MIMRASLIIAWLIASPAMAQTLPIGSVVDGDTVKDTAGNSYRAVDFDSPELYGDKCYAERSLGQRARWDMLFLAQSGARIEPLPCVGSNFDRLCARIVLNGKSVAGYMISIRSADPYSCDYVTKKCVKRRDWCLP